MILLYFTTINSKLTTNENESAVKLNALLPTRNEPNRKTYWQIMIILKKMPNIGLAIYQSTAIVLFISVAQDE